MPTILIVDDEKDIRELIAMNLMREEAYQILEAEDGLQALRQAKNERPDLIILDLMLPQMDGLTVYRNLRDNAITSQIPVIMLTARGRLEQKLEGLELGADDYMPKPFSPKELMLRVRNLLRRSNENHGASIVQSGPFSLDKNALKLHLEDEEIELTSTEFKLLLSLIESPGITQERGNLLQKVWGYSDLIQTRTLDTHIKRLREKLGTHGNSIETVRGVGYRFSET
ncbi:response regulator transcription factor [bacterium]|jgi:two-component system phosphate regulon response regulator PhoB|nr:response regulator transcription factor [Verrucomicrobiales bacterium]MDB2496149.1 response regulator transcription factor [Verrucomicrobiales bacterium]MDB3940436.1 response regulator transcription factor [Verrucomicrobiales bacterium]MDC0252497.1 response regulator transcription factor [bacterium]MDC3353367.1 response regulator transcription factor [Verrucomicrobiales bacterium]